MLLLSESSMESVIGLADLLEKHRDRIEASIKNTISLYLTGFSARNKAQCASSVERHN